MRPILILMLLCGVAGAGEDYKFVYVGPDSVKRAGWWVEET